MLLLHVKNGIIHIYQVLKQNKLKIVVINVIKTKSVIEPKKLSVHDLVVELMTL